MKTLMPTMVGSTWPAVQWRVIALGAAVLLRVMEEDPGGAAMSCILHHYRKIPHFSETRISDLFVLLSRNGYGENNES